MTHIVTQSETVEWEEELCDNCDHLASYHHDRPKLVVHTAKPELDYYQIGCMFPVFKMKGGRKIENNPHPRCPCMALK